MDRGTKRRPGRGPQARSDAHSGTLAAAPDAFRKPSTLRAHAEAGCIPALPEREYLELRADIELRGLLTPLEVTEENVVLDGHARLRAATDLGLPTVSVRLVSTDDELAYMLLSALRRRQLDPGQRAALALELDLVRAEKAKAAKRKAANGNGSIEVANLPLREAKTRDLAARIAGVSPRTVQEVSLVQKESPALYEEVKAGKTTAHRAAQQVLRERRRREARDAGPMPEAPFGLILADPPWSSKGLGLDWAPEQHYPTMELEGIKSLRIPAGEDAVCFLCAVSALLPEALEVLEAWGFTYCASLVWVKDRIGPGRWVRYRHELLLVGRRGKVPAPDECPDSVIEAPRRRHSQKPVCVYELLERAYPELSKLELFARGKARPGWAVWGNEVES